MIYKEILKIIPHLALNIVIFVFLVLKHDIYEIIDAKITAS